VHLKRGYDLGQGWAGIYLALIEIARWDGDLQAADRLRQMLDTMAAGTDNELRAQALALKGQLGLLVGAPKADVADLIDRASALLPDDAIVLDSRATLMAAEGKFSEADALLEKATETAEDWAPYLAKRSVIQQKLGNATRSEELKTLAENAVEGQYFLQFIEP
jgi:thioredoxin-like negative regulator of GroEL